MKLRPQERNARFSAKWRAATFNYCNGLANSRFHTLLFGINRLRSDELLHCWAKSYCSGAFVPLLCNQNWSVQKTIQSLVDLPWLNGIFEMFHVYPLPVNHRSSSVAPKHLICSRMPTKCSPEICQFAVATPIFAALLFSGFDSSR